jgi:DNA repair exonuclease SbcCD ATPase subunit
VQQLQSDLARAEHDLKARSVPTADELLPATVWRATEFDGELNGVVSKIGANTAFQPASRLHNVYHAISAHFGQLLRSREAARDEASAECQAMRTAVHEFVVNLSIAIGIDPLSYRDFFSQKVYNRIIETVTRLRAANDDLQRMNEQLNAIVARFHSQLDLQQGGDILQHINQLKERLANQCEVIQQRTKKCRDLRERFRALQHKSDTEIESLRSQVQSLGEELEGLTGRAEQLSATKHSLENELQTLSAAHRDLEMRAEESRIAALQQHEASLREAEESRAALEAQLREELRVQRDAYSQVCDGLAESADRIRLLKKTVRAQRETITEREQELAELRQEFQESTKQQQTRYEVEKGQMADAFHAAESELQRQCDAHRDDIQRLAKEIAALERRAKDAKGQMVEVRRDNMKLEKELRALEEQAERERKLHEAALRAAVLNAEAESAARMSEQKAAAENEKRRIIGFAADSFKQFFSPQDVIDERSFKQVIGRARDELVALTDTNTAVRRIVGAPAHQKTDDAVAQVVMARNWAQ